METLTITIFHLLWVYVKQKFAETKIETISLASSAAASMLQRPRPIIEANVVTVLDSGKVSIFCRFLLGVRKPNHVINESDVQRALSTNGWHPVMTQWGALMPSHWRTQSLQRCVTRDGIPTKWFLIVGLNLWYITLKEFHCSSMFKGKIENILEAALFFLQALITHGFQISLTPADLNNGTAILPPKRCKGYTCSGKPPLTLTEWDDSLGIFLLLWLALRLGLLWLQKSICSSLRQSAGAVKSTVYFLRSFHLNLLSTF